MPATLPPGPYRMIPGADGQSHPFYIIPFDKFGTCTGPRTRDDLVQRARRENYTDIFVFSHGWNNDFPTALAAYEGFIRGFMEMRKSRDLPAPENFKPLLVGIYWPSATFVFGRERGPGFAAVPDPQELDPLVASELRELEATAELLPPDQRARFYDLAQREEVDEAEARELATMVLSLPGPVHEEVDEAGEASVDSLLEVWQHAAASQQRDSFGPADFGTGTPVDSATEAPQAAGIGDFFRKLDPRPILRLPSVWRMKDRAGAVGAFGAGPLLRSLLNDTRSRVHLVGHSYGGKVVLSATCFGEALPRPVDSMLLLQPAVSHLALATRVPGLDRPGGYHQAPQRVRNPILSTYSSHDVPLTRAFHFAVRRDADLGEARIAAAGEPPSRFAALGGFGPREANESLIEVVDPVTPYPLDAGVPVYGINASRTIDGHGDISNRSTWWMLYSLLMMSVEVRQPVPE